MGVGNHGTGVSLQISVAPGDARHAREIVRHQLRQWAGQVDEVVLTLDLGPDRTGAGGRSGRRNADRRPVEASARELEATLADVCEEHPHARINRVDYSAEAIEEVSQRFFSGLPITSRDCYGKVVYSYFYGLYSARHRYVFHTDSDMLFGGGSQTWIAEARQLLDAHEEIFSCSPLPGPPSDRPFGARVAAGHAGSWRGRSSRAAAVPYTNPAVRGPAYRLSRVSTRDFMIDRVRLDTGAVKLRRIAPTLRMLIGATARGAILRGDPRAVPAEATLTRAMCEHDLTRVDFLGTAPGMWSIHPASRSQRFHDALPSLIARIERGEVTEAQRGDYDLSDSMLTINAGIGSVSPRPSVETVDGGGGFATPRSCPDLTVLVPVRNESTHIDAAVESMRAQRFDGQVEFLLLEGGSTDSTYEHLERVVAQDPRFRLISRPGTNVPERLNLGLREARGELIARMDAHAVFPPDYLQIGARRLVRGDVASASGPQLAQGDGVWSHRVALAVKSPLGRGGAAFRRLSSTEIAVDSGYCGVWKRSLLVGHGGWSEEAPDGEDTELAVRVRSAGGSIVCLPEMAAHYRPRDSVWALARQYSHYAYRRAWIARRHPSALRRSQLLPPAVLLLILAAATAPSRPRRLARAGAALYALVLVGEGTRIGKGQPVTDVFGVATVLAVMHLAWGAGFVFGCARNRIPYAALAAQISPARTVGP